MSSVWKDFQGVNQGYVLELYERFQRDPASVDAATRELFRTWTPPAVSGAEAPAAGASDSALVVGAFNYAQSIRRYGHLAAAIDPLGSRPAGDPALDAETHHVTTADLAALPASLLWGPIGDGLQSMAEVVERLQGFYCRSVGYDFAHIFNPNERHWLRDAVETGRFTAAAQPIDAIALLDRLTEVEGFERFLQRTFPGKTRFSIEGLDMLVPVLDEVIRTAAGLGVERGFIAMAHRGRLNVMAHVLGKPYAP